MTGRSREELERRGGVGNPGVALWRVGDGVTSGLGGEASVLLQRVQLWSLHSIPPMSL